jgi:hypothetical protein
MSKSKKAVKGMAASTKNFDFIKANTGISEGYPMKARKMGPKHSQNMHGKMRSCMKASMGE